MTPAALIFDVDGTLSETEDCHRRAFNETFAAFGLDWHWDRARYRRLLDVTGGKERIAHFIATHDPPGGAAIAELHAAKTARYVELIAAGAAALRPGVRRLIAEARTAGVPVAIATTTSLLNVEALVRTTLGPDSLDWFAAIGAGDMVAHKKPAPDVYQLVLDRLGLPGGACVAIEDSENGLASARAAGLATVVTPSVYTDDQRFDGALAVVSDLGEPGRPFRPIAGAATAPGVVTLEVLAGWCAGGGILGASPP